MIGLETALSVVVETMIRTGLMDWVQVAQRMSFAPAAISGIPGRGRPIAPGEPANLVLVDPEAQWRVEPSDLASRSPQHPYTATSCCRRRCATPSCADVPWSSTAGGWDRW